MADDFISCALAWSDDKYAYVQFLCAMLNELYAKEPRDSKILYPAWFLERSGQMLTLFNINGKYGHITPAGIKEIHTYWSYRTLILRMH